MSGRKRELTAMRGTHAWRPWRDINIGGQLKTQGRPRHDASDARTPQRTPQRQKKGMLSLGLMVMGSPFQSRMTCGAAASDTLCCAWPASSRPGCGSTTPCAASCSA